MPRSKSPAPDADNPEWTDEDFARARPASEVLPAAIASQFKTYRGPQKSPRKVAVSIRLSSEVVAHFKSGGPGWQSRIDEALKQAVHEEQGDLASVGPPARRA